MHAPPSLATRALLLVRACASLVVLGALVTLAAACGPRDPCRKAQAPVAPYLLKLRAAMKAEYAQKQRFTREPLRVLLEVGANRIELPHDYIVQLAPDGQDFALFASGKDEMRGDIWYLAPNGDVVHAVDACTRPKRPAASDAPGPAVSLDVVANPVDAGMGVPLGCISDRLFEPIVCPTRAPWIEDGALVMSVGGSGLYVLTVARDAEGRAARAPDRPPVGTQTWRLRGCDGVVRFERPEEDVWKRGATIEPVGAGTCTLEATDGTHNATRTIIVRK